MSGHNPHGRLGQPPPPASWNHLQVPSYVPRHPQSAHMSNERQMVRSPLTWPGSAGHSEAALYGYMAAAAVNHKPTLDLNPLLQQYVRTPMPSLCSVDLSITATRNNTSSPRILSSPNINHDIPSLSSIPPHSPSPTIISSSLSSSTASFASSLSGSPSMLSPFPLPPSDLSMVSHLKLNSNAAANHSFTNITDKLRMTNCINNGDIHSSIISNSGHSGQYYGRNAHQLNSEIGGLIQPIRDCTNNTNNQTIDRSNLSPMASTNEPVELVKEFYQAIQHNTSKSKSPFTPSMSSPSLHDIHDPIQFIENMLPIFTDSNHTNLTTCSALSASTPTTSSTVNSTLLSLNASSSLTNQTNPLSLPPTTGSILPLNIPMLPTQITPPPLPLSSTSITPITLPRTESPTNQVMSLKSTDSARSFINNMDNQTLTSITNSNDEILTTTSTSNDDSLDSSIGKKTRRRRKPNKTTRMSNECEKDCDSDSILSGSNNERLSIDKYESSINNNITESLNDINNDLSIRKTKEIESGYLNTSVLVPLPIRTSPITLTTSSSSTTTIITPTPQQTTITTAPIITAITTTPIITTVTTLTSSTISTPTPRIVTPPLTAANTAPELHSSELSRIVHQEQQELHKQPHDQLYQSNLHVEKSQHLLQLNQCDNNLTNNDTKLTEVSNIPHNEISKYQNLTKEQSLTTNTRHLDTIIKHTNVLKDSQSKPDDSFNNINCHNSIQQSNEQKGENDDCETIDKIQAMIESTNPQTETNLTNSTTTLLENTSDTKQKSDTDEIFNNYNQDEIDSKNSSFEEVENKLEEMFAGIEDDRQIPSNDNTNEKEQNLPDNQTLDRKIYPASSDGDGDSSSNNGGNSKKTKATSLIKTLIAATNSDIEKNSDKVLKRRNSDTNGKSGEGSSTKIAKKIVRKGGTKNKNKKKGKKLARFSLNDNITNNNGGGVTNGGSNSNKKIKPKDDLNDISSIKFKGPYVQVKKDGTEKIINTPITEEITESKGKPKKPFNTSSNDRNKLRGLHVCTLSMKYDADTTDKTWICVFCKMGPHKFGLGDLFGPYIISTKCEEYTTSQMDPNDDVFISKRTKVEMIQKRGLPKIVATSTLDSPSSSGGGNQKKKKKVNETNATTKPIQTNTNNNNNNNININTCSNNSININSNNINNNGNNSNSSNNNNSIHVVNNLNDSNIDIYYGMSKVNDDSYEVWMHEDCAVWSSGVHIIGTRIIGLEEAVWNSTRYMCVLCKRNGSVLCCLERGCNYKVHVPCARKSNWLLNDDDFKSRCDKHIVDT